MILQYPLRTIDLAVLRENVRQIRKSLPEKTMIMAVVKADGYGHGIVQVARNALRAGAKWLAVARTDEGALLRRAGIGVPVLVLGASTVAEIADGVLHGLTMTICSAASVYTLQKAAAASGMPGLMHLKIDTGMGRIGVRTEAEIAEVLHALQECPDVRLTGAYTHFADADGEDAVYTRMQLERFMALSSVLPEGVIRHCANSAAIHRYPEAALDMVRAGISMYGCPPVQTDMPLQPVLSWKTAVTHVKTVPAGEKISYGCTFTTPAEMRLATVACGYGDGYHRAATGRAEVILHGRRAPVVGRICMDQMMVDVTEIPDVVPGDEVMLLGRQGSECITADELAAWSNTIGYEVLLAATDRVHRMWLNDDV